MLLRLTALANNDRGPHFMEQVFAAIHQAVRIRVPFTLQIAMSGASTALFIEMPPHLRPAITAPLTASYPDLRLEKQPDDTLDQAAGHNQYLVAVNLTPDLFPIFRPDELQHDPLAGILAAVAKGENDPTDAQIVLNVWALPRGAWRIRALKRAIRVLDRPLFREHDVLADLLKAAATSRFALLRFLGWLIGLLVPKGRSNVFIDSSAQSAHSHEDVLQAAMLKLGSHLFEVRATLRVTAPGGAKRKAISKLQDMIGALGAYTNPTHATFRCSRVRRSQRRSRWTRGFLLSAGELAALFHPPTVLAQTPEVLRSAYRQLPPPSILPRLEEESGGAVELGRVAFRNASTKVRLALDDRRRHLFVVGKTGMGKSTLLLNMFASDMRSGLGVGLVDVHGDLADAALCHVPRARTGGVIYFDAGDRDYPVGFNPLQCRSRLDRPNVASSVVMSFKKVFGDSWGPRLENILRNGLVAILDTADPTLSNLVRLLTDSAYRKRTVACVDSSAVRDFFHTRFDRWNDRYREEAIEPVLNKVSQFLSNPLIYNIVEQSHAKLDIRSVMDDGQILIANLSKGRVGEDNAALLGAFLVNSIQHVAMARAELPECDRRDFFAYVDEFQNFVTDSFGAILSEARKYRLCLTIATQYLRQMERHGNTTVRDAVFGNVGTLVSFQVGADDADDLVKQLSRHEGDVKSPDLTMLPKHHAVVRLLIDGMPTQPFTMQTTPPPKVRDNPRADKVRRHSRKQYAAR